MEKITGIKFIDNFINRKGLAYCIRLIGKVFMVVGAISILGTLSIPLWKDKFLESWNIYSISNWIIYHAMYKDFISGLCSIGVGVGFLKFKEWGRKLLLYYYLYSICERIFMLIIGLKVIAPQASNSQGVINNYLTGFIMTVAMTCFAIYVFTRPKVKEQFSRRPKAK